MSDYIQLYPNIGHQNFKNNYMVKDDFYLLLSKKHKIGLRKKQRKDGVVIFKCNDIDIDYLYSDFARFCLALFKNSRNIHYGEMTLIPTKPIPISEELKEYIEEFLPDYYKIR